MSFEFKILAMILAFASPPLAASEWRRAAAGGVEVHTDAGTGIAERILAEALTFYSGCARVRGLDESLPPVKIVYFARESDFRRLRGEDYSKGFYHKSGAGTWILLHGGPDAVRRLRHELIHVMNDRAGFSVVPSWLNEGIAEYYSALDLSVAARGRTLVASIDNLARQASGEPFGEEDLANVRAARDQGLFYARAWALVRQMAIDGGDTSVQIFAGLLRDGMKEAQAFQMVYRTTAAEMTTRARLGAGRTGSGVIWAERPWPAATGPAALPVSRAEVERMFEEIRRSTGVPTLADLRREKALKSAGVGPDRQSRAAMVELGRGNLWAALELMRGAARAGTRDAVMWFEYAMLMRNTGQAKPEWLAALRRAVELDPDRAEAWFVLGVSSEADESISALHRAANSPHATSWMWEAYGRALLRGGRRLEARAAAQEAIRRAAGTAEKSMAEGLLASVDAPQSDVEAPRPPVITPGSWTGKDAADSFEGRLIEVDCSNSTPVLVVETNRGALRISVKRSSGVAVNGPVEFKCGPQTAERSVLVGHDGQADRALRTTGDLVSITGK